MNWAIFRYKRYLFSFSYCFLNEQNICLEKQNSTLPRVFYVPCIYLSLFLFSFLALYLLDWTFLPLLLYLSLKPLEANPFSKAETQTQENLFLQQHFS